MRVKIFQGWGFQQIEALEPVMNDWMEKAEREGWKIKHTQTALCGTGGDEAEGLTQAVVITVWYDL